LSKKGIWTQVVKGVRGQRFPQTSEGKPTSESSKALSRKVHKGRRKKEIDQGKREVGGRRGSA